MPHYTHGGDVWNYGDILDFSANLHPLGMPPRVLEAAQAAVAAAVHYPDPLCRTLRDAIALRDGVKADDVICSNGAAELIFRLCFALQPQKALVTAPAFSEYETALHLCKCAVDHYPLMADRQFNLDAGILDAIHPALDVLFLCHPNNPTGRLIEPGLLAKITARCRETDTRLIVDECFMELTDGYSLTGAVAANPHLFLLRAFTKTYAIPGLRLGYGLCADRILLEQLYCLGQPWTVSNVAQAAGIAACACPDWVEQGRELLRQERPRLTAALRNLGFTVWESHANYVLFCAPGQMNLRERLLKKGVLIRACGNFHGLSPDFYRVCVRKAQDNDILIQALQEEQKRL